MFKVVHFKNHISIGSRFHPFFCRMVRTRSNKKDVDAEPATVPPEQKRHKVEKMETDSEENKKVFNVINYHSFYLFLSWKLTRRCCWMISTQWTKTSWIAMWWSIKFIKTLVRTISEDFWKPGTYSLSSCMSSRERIEVSTLLSHSEVGLSKQSLS